MVSNKSPKVNMYNVYNLLYSNSNTKFVLGYRYVTFIIQ